MRAIVTEIVDNTIHNLLWGLEQTAHVQICVDGELGHLSRVSYESDGLAGELYGDNGWVARSSKYRAWE